MKPDELMSIANELMGFDLNEVLFKEDKSKRTKLNIVKLIMAKQDGIAETMLANVFNYIQSNETAPSEPEHQPEENNASEATETTYPDAPEGGREFGVYMDISDDLAAKGIGDTEVTAFIESKGLSYTDIEEFFRLAPGKLIDELINQNT